MTGAARGNTMSQLTFTIVLGDLDVVFSAITASSAQTR